MTCLQTTRGDISSLLHSQFICNARCLCTACGISYCSNNIMALLTAFTGYRWKKKDSRSQKHNRLSFSSSSGVDAFPQVTRGINDVIIPMSDSWEFVCTSPCAHHSLHILVYLLELGVLFIHAGARSERSSLLVKLSLILVMV